MKKPFDIEISEELRQRLCTLKVGDSWQFALRRNKDVIGLGDASVLRAVSDRGHTLTLHVFCVTGQAKVVINLRRSTMSVSTNLTQWLLERNPTSILLPATEDDCEAVRHIHRSHELGGLLWRTLGVAQVKAIYRLLAEEGLVDGELF